MPSHHARSASALLAAVVAFACGPSTEPVAGRTSTAPSSRPAASITAPGEAPRDAPRAAGEIALSVHDADGEPVVGREIRVVDRRGAVRFGATDEEGGVVVEDVEAPYDALVAGLPGDPARGVPTAVLGLVERESALVVDERDPSPPPQPESLRLAVLVPPTFRGAEVHAVSSSSSGSGYALARDVHGGEVAVMEIAHAFARGWTAVREEVRVHVVVRAAGGDAGYAVVGAGPVAPGELRDLGALEVARVGHRTETVEVDGSRLPPSWPRRVAAELALEGGTAVPLGGGEGEAHAIGVPVVPGSRLCVSAWAERPSEPGADLHAGARTRACAPVEGPGPRVELAAVTSPEVPRAGDGLARRGAGLRFATEEPCAPCTRDVRFVHEARGGVVLRVVTGTLEVPFARLSRLGAPSVPLGSAVLDVGVMVGVRPEEALSDVVAALEIARTSRRLRFVVTP